MDRGHSQLIVILLAGILAVLLLGREAVSGSLTTIFWLGLAIGIPILLIWALIAFGRYLKREVRDYRAEVQRDREQGLPWLYKYAVWPGILGNIVIVGIAATRYFDGSTCKYFAGDCLQSIPYWWVPITLFAACIPISVVEQIVARIRRRKSAE